MRPPALDSSQSVIAVATPASPPKSMEAYRAGIGFLRGLGFKIKTGRQRFPASGYLSGTDEERAAEFNSFIRDPEVTAIFCTRGGYGTMRILPLLDYEAAANTPRLLIGYSDITALQLALYKKAGWKSISGPMVAVEWKDGADRNEAFFWKLVSQSWSAVTN